MAARKRTRAVKTESKRLAGSHCLNCGNALSGTTKCGLCGVRATYGRGRLSNGHYATDRDMARAMARTTRRKPARKGRKTKKRAAFKLRKP